jgi:hypothetical protein
MSPFLSFDYQVDIGLFYPARREESFREVPNRRLFISSTVLRG